MLKYLIYVACGAVAAKIASDRGHNGAVWAFVSICCGPLGFIVLLLPKNTQPYVPSITQTETNATAEQIDEPPSPPRRMSLGQL